MDIFSIYITIFFFVFLIFPAIFFCVKLVVWCHTEYCKRPAGNNASRRQNDAQRSTVFTITPDPLTDDPRFTDFFWNVSPQTSASRDAIHKDDKDLPTYEEVIQMEMRQQIIGSPPTVAALPAAAPANETTTVTTVSERATPVSNAPTVATASV